MKHKFQVSSIKPFIDIEGLKGTETVERKQLTSNISISLDEDKTVIAVISNAAVDGDGDVVVPSGVDLSRFQKNPVICWSHDYSEPPIGKATAISVTDEGIVAKIKLADTERANDCWSLIKGGFLGACSIGFIIKDAVYRGSKEFSDFIKKSGLNVAEDCMRIITRFELLENSLCTIGCNPEALVTAISAKSINLSDKTIKELDLPKVVVVVASTDSVSTVCNDDIITDLRNNTSEIVLNEPVNEPVVAEIPVEKPEEKPAERYINIVRRSIKVIRKGGIDVKEEAKKRILVKRGKII